jgi:glycosyltransferase involved in cell wall biosynthesis
LKIDPAFKYILFFGFIKPYKGLDILLKSIDKVYFINNHLKLLIAGEVYGSDDKYHKLIKDLDLEELVIFHNRYITDEQVKSYFCAADLIAQTYLSATQSGISQIALHFEKSVLVTDVGGLSEMVIHQKTGYVVDKKPAAILGAIRDFFDNNRQAQFANDIVALKEENTWDRFAQKLLSFIFNTNK